MVVVACVVLVVVDVASDVVVTAVADGALLVVVAAPLPSVESTEPEHAPNTRGSIKAKRSGLS